MGLFLLAVCAALAIIVLRLLLLLIVPPRRARVLAPWIVASGIAGAGAGLVVMTLVTAGRGETLGSTQVHLFLGGIALFALTGAAVGVLIGLRQSR